jgi:hypothetical protein
VDLSVKDTSNSRTFEVFRRPLSYRREEVPENTVMSRLIWVEELRDYIAGGADLTSNGLVKMKGLKLGLNFSQGARITSPDLIKINGCIDVIQHSRVILHMTLKCLLYIIIETSLEGFRHSP